MNEKDPQLNFKPSYEDLETAIRMNVWLIEKIGKIVEVNPTQKIYYDYFMDSAVQVLKEIKKLYPETFENILKDLSTKPDKS